MKKWFKNTGWILLSLLAAWAPGAELTVQRKLLPDALDLGGYLYQLVGRTFASIGTDSVTLALALMTVLWLTRRYLYHKPKGTGIGEYLLCAFLTVMQLLNTAIRQADTVQVLGENLFQVIKVILYLPGMFTLFLCAVRALNELLGLRTKQKRIALWEKYPFLFPFLVLCIAWLPHLVVKYPGVIPMDTALQYHQFVGLDERTTPHPIFGTLIYGFVINAARNSSGTNWIYFAYTLVQSALFIAVLAYALSVMERRKLPMWLCTLSLVLFAISPIYVGWTTVMGKDSSYLITIMLAGTLVMEHLGGKRIEESKGRMLLLGIDLVLMMLVRNNGVTVAVPLLLVLLVNVYRQKKNRKACLRFACYACAVVIAFLGITETIIRTMGFERRSQDDWMALMFQQTAKVVTLHDEELPQAEKDVLGAIFVYDEIVQRYKPNDADPMRWNYPEDGRVDGEIPAFPEDNGRSSEEIAAYWQVWWEQLKRYPLDYLDATLQMNGILFDLQSNRPMYLSLTDHELTDAVYHDSFNDMSYYDAQAIRPLNSWQRALTEWYYRVSDLPLVGWLFSMGFCMEVMLAMLYLSWVKRRRQMLCILVPGLVVGASGLLCAIVYLRYLLPVVGMLPLWLAAWNLCESQEMKEE